MGMATPSAEPHIVGYRVRVMAFPLLEREKRKEK